MQNGTYQIESTMLNTKAKLVAYNGSLKIYNPQGVFLRTITKETLYAIYDIIGERQNGTNGLYDIAYIVDGRVKERKILRKPWSVVAYHMNQLRQSKNYSSGLLRPLRCNV